MRVFSLIEVALLMFFNFPMTHFWLEMVVGVTFGPLSVLMGFNHISGVGINFHKGKLIGINISSRFLEVETTFLTYRKEDKKFKFLGIPIGSNPRRISLWNPLLKKIKKRLVSWKGRFVSLDGRLTLLKLVLGSLAIFTLSFYKAPTKVVEEITMIQSNFLWGVMGKMYSLGVLGCRLFTG